jgi:heterodisulfide reductase subunit A
MLSPFFDVSVIEEADSFGGLGATFSCKSGEECGVCSACTIPELVEVVMLDPRIELHHGTRVEGVEQYEDGRWELHISGNGPGTIVVEAVILATGLDVADGMDVVEYGAGRLDGVITALELDRILRTSSAGDTMAVSEPPLELGEGSSVAFIQCVCSRDEGRLPYCSRVCCAYTARLALEMRASHPETAVTVFYMDLQRADQVSKVQLDAAQGDPSIEYVRSRPASVQPLPDGRLDVLYEDTVTGDILTRTFDRVVLSTGLVPSQGTSRMAGLFGLALDPYGFIEVRPREGSTLTSQPGVLAAGGATGPVDLVEASLSGMAAAAEVLWAHPPSWSGSAPRMFIVGHGPGTEPAKAIGEAVGASVAVLCSHPGEETNDSSKPNAWLYNLDGEPLDFRAWVKGEEGEPVSIPGDIVVMAPTPRAPWFEIISGNMTYDRFWSLLDEGWDAKGLSSFLLVMDDGTDALQAAAALRDARPRAEVDLLFTDMAVAEEGMQELQFELASAGVRFHRYSAGTLSVDVLEDGTRSIRFMDELSPELGEIELVVDHLLTPDSVPRQPSVEWPVSKYAPIGDPTPLRLNPEPVLTPRRGVYTSTPATLTGASIALGGTAAAMMALADFARGFPVLEEIAKVDEELCAACLNCIRVCPHDAISFDMEARAARVLTRACQDCGLCGGICPAQAITMVAGETVKGDPDG